MSAVTGLAAELVRGTTQNPSIAHTRVKRIAISADYRILEPVRPMRRHGTSLAHRGGARSGRRAQGSGIARPAIQRVKRPELPWPLPCE